MFKRPKGTKDIYGQRQEHRTLVLKTLEGVASFYNFKEIETPIFESVDLFKRSVGETSDIVTKEMYEFKDKKGREFVLRPEGTAGTIRAFVENKMYAQSQPTKLFYNGPIFRYERPQKGRQRQFTQFGIELIGAKSPAADAEAIMMAHQMLMTLKIKNVKLLINSIGDANTRNNYSDALRKYFEDYKEQLTELSISRLEKNPLRILDDKIDGEKDFVKNAPKISEFYTNESKEYFEKVKKLLDGVMIPYEVSDKLVRGLDYYSETIFEFVSGSEAAGSQSTIIGGGRYDNLVEQFGGPSISGVGFGLGVERLVNEVEMVHGEIKPTVDAFVVNMDDETTIATSSLTYMLRTAGFVVEYNLKPMKLNKAFDKSKTVGAKFVIIFGKNELKNGKVVVKNQSNGEQEAVDLMELVDYLDERTEQ
ncbi:histidine--tRNA ligase [Mycoplasma todarodis]|uniref:Histidine--tRNA ligase n=1 Tax=Mycoplasma todarodis TaxID=1937191 RepID=A0A4R0XQP9_9MOLU|nr:histidine--tRNA ligase [Mycoplasma todarodis]TCG11205.1 histidine--tRNA ligase [Mycoplasma todarodis]